MAHFAEIDKDNKVVQVVVVSDEFEKDGQKYLSKTLGFGGTWIQTSYNSKIRGVYAGPEYTYDEVEDIFITPQPYPSWIREGSVWNAPVEYPQDGESYSWNEKKKSWDLIETLSE
jgi:hypothetical protein